MSFPSGCFLPSTWFHEATGPGGLVWPALALACFVLTPVSAQTRKPAPPPPDLLQQHYDAARTFQLGGDQEHASGEYKLFLAGALRRIGNARAHGGEFSAAAQAFEEALAQTPDNPDLQLDFAATRLQEGKLPEARSLAEKALATQPENPKAHSLLGRIFYEQGEYKAAREQLEAAVVEAPSFDVGYLLGTTYLKLNDLNRATLLFNEMAVGLGDSAQIHMYFARAYREGQFFDQAVEEVKKAIARDRQTPQAHYFLGLAIVGRDGDSGFPAAIPEFRAALRTNPDDSRAHYMLGYILQQQRNLEEAESELARAASLDPQNPDPLVFLGQLYNDTNRPVEAEATLRKAIALTRDVSRNQYQISRTHYVLGRILLHTGRREEGEKELQISQELRRQVPNPGVAKEEKLPSSASLAPDDASGLPGQAPISPEEAKKAEAYAEQLKPAIADAYNNLGVAAAARKDFTAGLAYFQQAAHWDPALATIDRNLGMAAFYANQYDQVVAPLERHLQGHSDDIRARAALGLSLFTRQNYGKALETLRPMETEVNGDPGLAYAYAVSQVKAGDYTQGVDRLKALEKANPGSADIHGLLGDAFADQGVYGTALEEYRKAIAIDPNQARTHFVVGLALIHQGAPAEAVPELRTALKLDPSDVAAKYHLAFALIQTQQKEEAVPLLQEVIRQDPKHADAYYQLGKMQLEQGDTKAAISNLETGTKLNPDGDYIHYQLALAYRRDLRIQDAEREMKLYQALKERRRGRNAPQTN